MKLAMNFECITVGETIHNTNETDYVVVAINPEKDRTLLVQKNTEKPYYVGAWALQQSEVRDGWYWGQGHYFGSDLKSAMDYVLDIVEKKQEDVYYIKGKNDDTDEFDCGIATTEKKAKEMVDRLYELFEEAFEFNCYKQRIDTLCLNDKIEEF